MSEPGRAETTEMPHPHGVLEAICEASADAIIGESLSGIITFWNPAAERMFGYSRAEMLGQPIETIVPPERAGEDAQLLTRILSGEQIARLAAIRVHKSGHRVEISITAVPTRNEHGRIVGVVELIRDISAEEASRGALRDSEARHRAVIQTAVDGIITIDERGAIESLNPAAERLFGASAAELLGKNISVLMPSPYRDEHDGYLARYLRTGERKIIGIGREVIGLRKDGTTFPMDLAVSELTLGGRRMFTGLVRDISERKQAEARQRRMTDELDHRVKNNLAAVLGLATQTMATACTFEQFSAAFAGRLRAMAQTHSALAKQRWQGVGLGEIAEMVLGPYRDDRGERIRVQGPVIRLSARAAPPVTLALHELATNAVKYGALSSPSGCVELRWVSDGPDVAIEWLECGGPPVSPPSRPGSGSVIISGLIRYELRGSLEMRYDPAGFSCDIRFSDPPAEPSPSTSSE